MWCEKSSGLYLFVYIYLRFRLTSFYSNARTNTTNKMPCYFNFANCKRFFFTEFYWLFLSNYWKLRNSYQVAFDKVSNFRIVLIVSMVFEIKFWIQFLCHLKLKILYFRFTLKSHLYLGTLWRVMKINYHAVHDY